MSPRSFLASSLIYALSNIPSLDLPSVKGIIIMLCIYIFIVGPINYLVLRRMRRLHLAWVTIPVITAIFALGTFGIGYTMRGNDLVLNKIALVQVGTNGDAPITSYMGLFSPRQQAYEISVQWRGAAQPNDWLRVRSLGNQAVSIQPVVKWFLFRDSLPALED